MDRQRETGGSSDSKYKVDALPPLRQFEAGGDDGNLNLHPARFGPRPFCDEEELYKHIPMKLEHVYKNINLALFGACKLCGKLRCIMFYKSVTSLKVFAKIQPHVGALSF